ncbi:MAG: hypothetical protein ACREQP_08785, partial [Candidatus Binatia bacterium]
MKIAALIPAKGFTNAKQRLSSLLGAAERAALAAAMLRDVLRVTLAARGLDSVYVVTGDAKVREIAAAMGATVIMEQEEKGETEARQHGHHPGARPHHRPRRRAAHDPAQRFRPVPRQFAQRAQCAHRAARPG